MDKRIFRCVLTLFALALVGFCLPSCGGGDDDGNGGGNNGGGGNGGGGTTSVSIIGTWRAYYQSNDPSRGQVYDLVTFNADHTGYVIEEVGYGSDTPQSFTWTQTGNVIKVTLAGNYVITWTIQQVVNDNTVVISDGTRTYNVIRDGTGGGGSGGSGGSGGTSSISIIGTWRAYYQSNDPSRGQVYDLVTFNADHTGYVIEEVGYGSDTPQSFTWTQTGDVIKVTLAGNYVITWTIQQVVDDNTVVISDGTRTYNVARDGTGGGGDTPPASSNPVLGTFNFVYQSYYDETPYDYYGGFVTIDEDPYNTVGENSINIANLYLEGSNLVGYYDLDKDSVYIAAWQTIGVSGEYGLITVNWKDTKSDWIPFSINKDGSLTSDRFGVYSYDADFVEQKGWWEAATIATLTPTNSASSRRTSAKRSVTTKAMRINKVRLSNKRVKK